MRKEKLNKKGNLKMTKLETLKLDVVNTLNHNNFDEVQISKMGDGFDFNIRVGHWGKIEASLIETMEEYHSIRITEIELWDDDCGDLYSYGVEVIDEDTGYTLNELNDLDSNYTEEALYLESVGADDTWGNA